MKTETCILAEHIATAIANSARSPPLPRLAPVLNRYKRRSRSLTNQRAPARATSTPPTLQQFNASRLRVGFAATPAQSIS